MNGNNGETDMNLQKQLFEGERIRLASLDLEKDAEIESKWTQDAGYLRLLDPSPARPRSPLLIKKSYEELEKRAEEKGDHFYFTIRLREEDSMIGFARLYGIHWPIPFALIQLGIGEEGCRGRRYGSEALELLLGYAFQELRLFSVGAHVPEYNPVALHLFEKAGFVQEARLRQSLFRQGRRWDMILFGLLEEEWRVNHG